MSSGMTSESLVTSRISGSSSFMVMTAERRAETVTVGRRAVKVEVERAGEARARIGVAVTKAVEFMVGGGGKSQR